MVLLRFCNSEKKKKKFNNCKSRETKAGQKITMNGYVCHIIYINVSHRMFVQIT